MFIVVTFVFLASTVMMADSPSVSQDRNSFVITNMPGGDLESSDVTATNQYTGTGTPLAFGEWADSRNTTTGLSFIGASATGRASIRLAEGWDGMAIYTRLYNLKDIESWTRNPATTFDGTSDQVNNFGGSVAWTYGEVDTTNRVLGSDNAGNYLVADLNPSLGGLGTQWVAGHTGYWQQSMNVPRGMISRMWVAFDYWAGTKDQNADGSQDPFVPWDMVKIYANVGSAGNIANAAQRVFEIPSGQIPNKNNAWNPTGLRVVPQSIIDAINSANPTPGNPVVIRVGILNSESYSTNVYNGLTRFRNIRVFIEALALPVQLNLRVSFDGVGGNGGTQNAIQNIGTTYGVGQLNYTATPSRWLAGAVPLDINSTLRTNATMDFPADALETVKFDMYQVIYGTNQKNSVTGSSLTSPDGTTFTTANGTNTNWQFYFYDRPPQIPLAQEDYINYKFNGTKPSDWTITSVLDSQPVEKISFLVISGGGTRIEMPASQAAFYGFWSFTANSPNYVDSVATPAYVYEGEQLNINGTIRASTLTDSYLSSTNAELTIKFPNGTIWSSQYRKATVSAAPSRQFQFAPITIPISGPNYVAGVYTAIVTWNNSRSGLPLNETGCMVRTFIVRHRSTLDAEKPVYWDNLNTQQALPIQLRYVDMGGGDIPSATISFLNFNGVVQTFIHVAGYYNYLALLNCTNGAPGLNHLAITAVDPAFEPKNLTLGVEIARTSEFSIDLYPSVSVQWNDNFDLVLNYTDAVSKSGIPISSPNNITVSWPEVVGKYSIDMGQAASGLYRITFNTSSTLPNTRYSVPITIKELGYLGRTVLMDIFVTPRLTSLNLIPIPDVAFGELMIVNSNFRETSSGTLITGAVPTAQILGYPGVTVNVAAFGNGTYRFSASTATLPGLGPYTLEVIMTWTGVPYYANQTRTLAFNTVQRQTQAYATETFDLKYWGSNFTVPLYYLDVLTSDSIGGTNVNIQIRARDGATDLTTVNTATWIRYNGMTGPWLLTFNASHFGRTNTGTGFTVTVSINWTRTAAPFYVNQTVTFVIRIDEAPTFLYIKDPSKQTVPFGSNHTITFNLINQRTGLGIGGMDGNITVTSQGNLPNSAVFHPIGSIFSPVDNGSYVLVFNITSLSGDYITFNISIRMTFYTSIKNYSFTLIKIAPVPVTEVNPVIPVHLDQQVTITIFYHLAGEDTQGIPDATVSIQNNTGLPAWLSSEYSAVYDGSKYYNIWFTPSFNHLYVRSAGSYSVFVNFTSSYGVSQVRVNFVVNPIPTNISNVYFNGTDYTGTLPTYTVFIGDKVNVSVYFENTFNNTVVTDAQVTISRSGFPAQSLTQVGNVYYYVLSTTTFGLGSFEFTISATRNNFLQASQKIKLDIQPVSTDVVIQLNNTGTGTFEMFYGESLLLAFLYNNTYRNSPIRSGLVTLTIPVLNSSFTVNASGWWRATINAATIGRPGVYSITLSVGLSSYETAVGTFLVTIKQIPTSSASYNPSGQLQDSFSLYWGQTLVLAVRYWNTLTSNFITGASMSVTSSLVNSSFSRTGTWYNYTFNTGSVTPNVYTISISANLANYTSSTVLITVTVLAVPTNLRVYDGSTLKTTYDALFGQNVTFKLQLWDTLNDVALTGVTLTYAQGYHFPTPGQPGNYTFVVNTTRWTGVGIVQFTITASRPNYIASSEVITINIKPITTDIRVYIKGVDRTSTLQDTINFLETFTITVYYNNTVSNRPITGATVQLGFSNTTGSYTFNLNAVGTTGNYTRLFDSATLGSALGNQYTFDLSALLTNHESVFARINIFYNPIPTALNVSYAGMDLPRSGPANTVQVVYSDTLVLAVNMRSYLEGNKNLNSSIASVSAIINQRTVNGAYNGSAFIITVFVNNTIYGLNAGFTHQVLIIGDAVGYKSDSFSVLVNVLPIYTNLSVFINETYYTGFLSSTLFLKNTLSFKIYYERFYNGYEALIQKPGVTLRLSFLNDTSMTQTDIAFSPALFEAYATYDLVLDLNTFRSGLKDFYITTSLTNYETKQLKLSLNINKVNTTLSTLINGLNQVQLNLQNIQIDDTIRFTVAYNEASTLQPVLGATIEVRYVNDISGLIETITLGYNATDGTYTSGTSGFVLSSSKFLPQLKIFTISAQLDNHEARSGTFLVNINRINSTLVVLVNGFNQAGIKNQDIRLGDSLAFSVAYRRGDTSAPILGASVSLIYLNDVTQTEVVVSLVYNSGTGTYIIGAGSLVLDTTTFFAQLKVFTITAQRNSYQERTSTFIVNIGKIKVSTTFNMTSVPSAYNVTGSAISSKPGERITIRINVMESLGNMPMSSINTSEVELFLRIPGYMTEVPMQPEYIGPSFTGCYVYTITAPTTAGSYEVIIRIKVTSYDLLQQYDFGTEADHTYVLSVIPTVGIPVWVIYILIGAILVITAWFIAYQVRFKYPPLVRKIMDLRRAVARSKESSKIRPAKVMSREENIYSHFAKVINSFSFLQTRDTRYAAKTGGYKAETKEAAETTTLDWEIPAIEAPEAALPEVGAKGLKKAKGYVVPEAIKPAAKPAPVPVPAAQPVAPVEPAKPAVPAIPPATGAPAVPVVKPAAPTAVPAPAAKPMVKAPALAALPKPSVAPLKAVRPGVPTVKPAPGVAQIAKPGAAPGGAGGESHENLYQQLVLLEQKRYKAERSLRDLDAKHAKGLISDDEHKSYQEKIAGGLDKIKQQIADIRRKLISF